MTRSGTSPLLQSGTGSILRSGTGSILQRSPAPVPQRGFTRIELAVVLAIVAVLVIVLINRAVFYQEQAEKIAAEQMVDTLRSALRLQLTERFMKGDTHDVAQLAGQNPMNWLADKPENYVGEYYSPEPALIKPGHWYFDRHDRHLIYLPVRHEHLHTVAGAVPALLFESKLLTSSPVTSGSTAQNSLSGSGSTGVALEPVQAYTWF